MPLSNEPSSITLVLASTNVHKVREFRSMLKPYQWIDLFSLRDFPQYQPPVETGTTFAENSELKALHAARDLKKWVLADDSGLVVPALSGAPGIYSARFAGSDATDADNRKKLLKEMHSWSGEARNAYFECSISLSSPKGLEKSASSICEGEILSAERGGGGFGYDPLFVKHGYSKTFSELEEAIKNRISHRRKALDKIIPFLESLLGQA